MAWTTSAGPGGGFALEADASRRVLSRMPATLERALVSTRPRQLALAAAAHLASLAILAPFVGQNPTIAIPVIIGLAVSCAIFARTLGGPQSTCTSQVLPDDNSDSVDTLDTTAQVNSPPPTALDWATTPARPHGHLSPSDVSAELRADLMARVSHELRTPLNAVMGFSDLMGHQLFGPLGHPRYAEYVSHIRESSQKLLKSTEDTLAMTSLMARSASHCDRETLDLDSLVKSARSAVATDAGRRSISTLLMLNDDIDVIANRRALRQALVNILTEAIDRAADGAEIVITTQHRGDKLTLSVSIDRALGSSGEAHASLPMCLARALLELDGCRLTEHETRCGNWSATISLDCATQQDFFAPRRPH
jgi:signal transduction histidine kinase